MQCMMQYVSRCNHQHHELQRSRIATDLHCRFYCFSQGHVLLVSTHPGELGFPKRKERKESLIKYLHTELYEEAGLDEEHTVPIDTENIFFNEIIKKRENHSKIVSGST